MTNVKFLLLHSNTGNQLIVLKKMFGLIKNINKMCLQILYMYKKDLVLNNKQLLICHKSNQTKTMRYINIGGVKAIIGNGYGDLSSNPGQGYLHFT